MARRFSSELVRGSGLSSINGRNEGVLRFVSDNLDNHFYGRQYLRASRSILETRAELFEVNLFGVSSNGSEKEIR